MDSTEIAAQTKNLTELRTETVKLIAFFVGPMGYLWLAFVIWPLPGREAPPAAWAGSIALILSTILSYRLRQRFLPLASGALMAGILLAIAGAVLAFRSPYLTYLFVLPVIFSSILLGQEAVFVTAALTGLLSATIGIGQLGQGRFSFEVWYPLALICLVAIASYLSARSLYIALEWTWSGYQRAQHNERAASERQAELRRALKALDEATFRLERANYMLTLARDQAEEARRAKQQFAQAVSHELRTPLNLIVGFTELIVQAPEYYGGPLPPAYARDLGIVHRNACHLQTLLNDVLDLARIEAAEMSVLPQEADPEALVQEAVSAARSLVEARGLALRVDIEPHLPPLWLDPARIRQVLYNLLSNAARFTLQGSITVSVGRQGEEVLFAVTDTGVGIAPQDIPRIFAEFQQLDPDTRDPHGGSGLGLPISRRFVELHGGRMGVESQVGLGSTFHFTLPIAAGHPVAPAVAGRPRSAPAVPASPAEERILLTVTRSPAAAALFARYVRRCRTIIVEDLEHAQQAARQMLPQAVVIDAAAASFDAGALRELAQEWGLPQTPFLACTLPGEEVLRQRLDVEGYLVKPISRQSLWDVLRRFGEGVDRVLVIDDDRDFARLLGRLLDSPVRRYQVMGAHSGREGLEMVQHYQPDLVLLDLMLPDMNGAQVISRLRADPSRRGLPIVVVSAQDQIDTLGAVPGDMLTTKAAGLLPGELVQWVQSLLDTATHNGQQAPGDGAAKAPA